MVLVVIHGIGSDKGRRRPTRDGLGLMRFPGGKWYLGGWKGGVRNGEGVEGDGARCSLVWTAGGEEVHPQPCTLNREP